MGQYCNTGFLTAVNIPVADCANYCLGQNLHLFFEYYEVYCYCVTDSCLSVIEDTGMTIYKTWGVSLLMKLMHECVNLIIKFARVYRAHVLKLLQPSLRFTPLLDHTRTSSITITSLYWSQRGMRCATTSPMAVRPLKTT